MFRTSYDGEATVFSPVGRLHQVEYSIESQKLGSATVGCRSKTHVVVAAHKRSSGPHSASQPKIFTVDDHVGISIAGLAADARVLLAFLRREALNHRYAFGCAHPLSRLVTKLADSMSYPAPFAH
jgi:20S proteasome subunit alpha 6